MPDTCLVINKSKKQYLNGLVFGHHRSSWETIANFGVSNALAVLLIKTGRLGDNKLIGSWVGDEVMILSDYYDEELFEEVSHSYKDISIGVRHILEENNVTLLPIDLYNYVMGYSRDFK